MKLKPYIYQETISCKQEHVIQHTCFHFDSFCFTWTKVNNVRWLVCDGFVNSEKKKNN